MNRIENLDPWENRFARQSRRWKTCPRCLGSGEIALSDDRTAVSNCSCRSLDDDTPQLKPAGWFDALFCLILCVAMVAAVIAVACRIWSIITP